MSSGASISFNDPRRFGSMKIVRAGQAGPGAVVAVARSRTARQRLRCRHAGARLPGQENLAQGRAAGSDGSSPGSATSMSARRCIAPGCRHAGRPRRWRCDRARRMSAPSGWSMPSGPFSTMLSGRAGRRCAIIARQSGELGLFQHNFRVYDREGAPCPTPGCKGDPAHRAVRPLDVLLSGVSEIAGSSDAACRGTRHIASLLPSQSFGSAAGVSQSFDGTF